MTSRSAFRFVVTLALVFAVAGAYGIFTAKASGSSSASARIVEGAPPPTASAAETLAKTVVVQGESFLDLPPATFVAIDGTTIRCPRTCSFGGENKQQVLATATSNIAILTSVDGTFIGVGPYLGPVTTDYEAKQWSDFGSGFSAASHSLQTWVYMRDADATAYWYTFNYRVYVP